MHLTNYHRPEVLHTVCTCNYNYLKVGIRWLVSVHAVKVCVVCICSLSIAKLDRLLWLLQKMQLYVYFVTYSRVTEPLTRCTCMWCRMEYSGENGHFGPAVCLSTASWSTVFEWMEWFLVCDNQLVHIGVPRPIFLCSIMPINVCNGTIFWCCTLAS